VGVASGTPLTIPRGATPRHRVGHSRREPVVCIHGLSGHGGRFRGLAGRLADGRVVAVDLRGHGRSVHLVRGPDGRWRWRYSATAAIVAWSELANEAPPWAGCTTLVVLGERSWIPNRVPRMAHLTSVPVPGGHVVLWDDFDETAEAVGFSVRRRACPTARPRRRRAVRRRAA
jgi:hypothetical protein